MERRAHLARVGGDGAAARSRWSGRCRIRPTRANSR
jgi:hypothetical protein